MTIPELQQEINRLVDEYLKLVNPTKDEVQTALGMLTDDPLNDIHEICNPDNTSGKLLIADEVVVMREIEEEEKNV